MDWIGNLDLLDLVRQIGRVGWGASFWHALEVQKSSWKSKSKSKTGVLES